MCDPCANIDAYCSIKGHCINQHMIWSHSRCTRMELALHCCCANIENDWPYIRLWRRKCCIARRLGALVQFSLFSHTPVVSAVLSNTYVHAHSLTSPLTQLSIIPWLCMLETQMQVVQFCEFRKHPAMHFHSQVLFSSCGRCSRVRKMTFPL